MDEKLRLSTSGRTERFRAAQPAKKPTPKEALYNQAKALGYTKSLRQATIADLSGFLAPRVQQSPPPPRRRGVIYTYSDRGFVTETPAPDGSDVVVDYGVKNPKAFFEKTGREQEVAEYSREDVGFATKRRDPWARSYRELPDSLNQMREREILMRSRVYRFNLRIGYLRFKSIDQRGNTEYYYDAYRYHGLSRALTIDGPISSLTPKVNKTVWISNESFENINLHPSAEGIAMFRLEVTPLVPFEAEIILTVKFGDSPIKLALIEMSKIYGESSNNPIIYVTLEKLKGSTPRELDNIPAYRVSPVILDRFGKVSYANATEANECVLTALDSMYGSGAGGNWRTVTWFKPPSLSPNQKKNRERYGNEKPIMYWFAKWWKEDNGDNWDRKGVTVAMLKRWFIEVDVSFYACDANEDIIDYNVASSDSHIPAFCCIFSNGHCYMFRDRASSNRLNEKTHHIAPSKKNIYNPGLVSAKVDFDHLAEDDDVDDDTRETFAFAWDRAHHIICRESELYDDAELFKVLNTPHTVPTVYITDARLNGVVEYAKSQNILLYFDRNPLGVVMLRGISSVARDSVRILYCEDYDVIMSWCKREGIVFTDKVTLAAIGLSRFHEVTANKYAREPNPELSGGESAYCEQLIAEYNQADAQKGRPVGQITAWAFFNLWSADPYCKACQKLTYLNPNSDSAGLDRINRIRGYELDNVRVLHTECIAKKGRSTLSTYRQKRGITPYLNSNYSDELFRMLCGSVHNDIKARAWIGMVQPPGDGHLLQLDLCKAYLSVCYQGLHPAVAGVSTDGLAEFGYNKFGWFVLSGYEKPQEININGRSLKGQKIDDAIYWVVFDHGLGLRSLDPVAALMFTNGWYEASQVWYFANMTDINFGLVIKVKPDTIYYPELFRDFVDSQVQEFGIGIANRNVHVLTGYTGKFIDKSTQYYECNNQDEAFGYFANKGNPKYNIIRRLEHSQKDENGVRPRFWSVQATTTTMLQTNALPIYNRIIRDSKIRTYHMYRSMVTASNGEIRRHNLIQIRVDGVIVEFPREFDKAQATIEARRFREYKVVPSYNLLVNARELCIHNDKTPAIPAPVWNSKPAQTGDLRDYLLSALDTENPKDRALRDQIEAAPLNWDSGLLIEGPPGVGKSTVGSYIYKYFHRDGNENHTVMVVCPTNEAAARWREFGIAAKTIHSGLHIEQDTSIVYKEEAVNILILDECYMVDGVVLAAINNLRRRFGFRVYALGDKNQLDNPDSTIDIDTRADSWIFGDVCGWQKMELMVNLRSDSEVFDLCASIVKHTDPAKAFAWLNARVNPDNVAWKHLCKTHRKRLEVNERLALRFVAERPGLPTVNVVFAEEDTGRVRRAWSCAVVADMPVVCEVAYKKQKIAKGDRFRVRSWYDAPVDFEKPESRRSARASTVRVFELVDPEGQVYTISDKVFAINFRVAFAVTVHRSQGSTIREPYVIHEADRYCWRMMNVAISRTTDPRHVIVDTPIRKLRTVDENGGIHISTIEALEAIPSEKTLSLRDHVMTLSEEEGNRYIARVWGPGFERLTEEFDFRELYDTVRYGPAEARHRAIARNDDNYPHTTTLRMDFVEVTIAMEKYEAGRKKYLAMSEEEAVARVASLSVLKCGFYLYQFRQEFPHYAHIANAADTTGWDRADWTDEEWAEWSKE